MELSTRTAIYLDNSNDRLLLRCAYIHGLYRPIMKLLLTRAHLPRLACHDNCLVAKQTPFLELATSCPNPVHFSYRESEPGLNAAARGSGSFHPVPAVVVFSFFKKRFRRLQFHTYIRTNVFCPLLLILRLLIQFPFQSNCAHSHTCSTAATEPSAENRLS